MDPRRRPSWPKLKIPAVAAAMGFGIGSKCAELLGVGFAHVSRFGDMSDQLSVFSFQLSAVCFQPDALACRWYQRLRHIQLSKNARGSGAGRRLNGRLLCMAKS
jgi:hypothetical protein